MRLKMRLTRPEQAPNVILGQGIALVRVVVRGGVEPPTFRFSGGRSYRLSYLTLPRPAALGQSGPDGI